MGTSSIYGGHKDNRGLLPDDYKPTIPDKPDSSDMPPAKLPSIPITDEPWKTVKTGMSKYLTGSGNSVSGIIRKYGKASGGAIELTRSSSSGIASGARLSHFLGSLSSGSISDAFKDFRILLDNETIYSALSKLADSLSPSPNNKEDSIARNAIIEALSIIYELIESDNQGFESIEKIDETMKAYILSTFIDEYIWGKMLNDLEICFEKHCSNLEKAQSVEKEFRDYIHNVVEIKVSEVLLTQPQGTLSISPSTIEKIFRDCYEVLINE